jgi:hypothetical protein
LGNTSTIRQVDDRRVIVSGQGGLDFIAEERATSANSDPTFPVVSHNISIKKGTVTSSLSMQSMTLAPSPSPSCECSSGQWCECFESCLCEEFSLFFPHSFSASLIGMTVEVRFGEPRTILVSFEASHAGTCDAVLKIYFSDKTRPNDQVFAVTRELRGRAILPASGSPVSSRDVPNMLEETTEGEDARITISPDGALAFSAESPGPNQPFARAIKNLIIFGSSNTLVSFVTARIDSPDASTIE